MPVYIQRETIKHINTEYSNLTPQQKKKKYLRMAESVDRAQRDREIEEQNKILEEKQRKESEAERDRQFQELMAQKQEAPAAPTILDLSGKPKAPLLDLAAPTMEQRQDAELARQAEDLQRQDLESFTDIPEDATPEEAAMILEQQGRHKERLAHNLSMKLAQGTGHTLFSLFNYDSDNPEEQKVIDKAKKMFPYQSYNFFNNEGDNVYTTFAKNVQTWLNRSALYDNLYLSKKYPTYDLPQDEFDITKGSTYKNIPYQAANNLIGMSMDLLLTGGVRALAGKATGLSVTKYAENLGEKYFQKLLTKGAPKVVASAAKFGTKAAINAPIAGGSLFNYTYSQNVNNLINSEGYSIDDPNMYSLALKRSLTEASLEGIFDQTKFLQGGGEEIAGLFGKKALLKQTAKGVGKEMIASGAEEGLQSLATAPFDFDAADRKIAEIQKGVQEGKIDPQEGQALIAETKMTIGKAIKQATGEAVIGAVTPIYMKSIHLPSLTLNNAEIQGLGYAMENQDALDDYLAQYVKTGKTVETYREKKAQADKVRDFVSQVKNEYDYWATNDAPALYQEAKGRKVMTSSDAMKMGVQVAKLNSIAQQIATSTDEFQTNNLKGQAKLVAESIRNINNGTDIGQSRVTSEQIASMVAKTTPIGNFTTEQANRIIEQPGFQQDVLSGARDFNRIVKNDPEVSQYVQDIEQGRLKIDDKVSGNPILDANNNIIDGKKRFAKAFVDAKNSGNFNLSVTKAVEGKALLGIAAASATEIPSTQIVSPFKNNIILDTLFNGVADNFKIARKEITDNKGNKSDAEVNEALETLIFDTVKELSLSGVKYNDLSQALQRIAGVTPMVAEGNIKYMANNNMLPTSNEIKKALKEKAAKVIESNKEIGLDDELNLPKETRDELNKIDKEKDAQIAAIPTVAEQTTVAKETIRKSRSSRAKKEASVLLNDPKAFYEAMADQAVQLKLDLEEAGQPTAEADAAIQQYTQVANDIKAIEQKAEVKKKKVTENAKATPAQTTAPSSDIEAKKADIEKRRQEELNKISVDSRFKPGAGKQVKVGQEFNDGYKVIVLNNTAHESYNPEQHGEGYTVYSKIVSDAEYTDGKLTKAANVETETFPDKKTADKVLQERYDKLSAKEKEGTKKSQSINAKYDAELATLEQQPSGNTAPMTTQEGNTLIDRLNGEIKAIEAQIKTLRQEEVSLGTVEYKPEGKIVGYVGAAENFEYKVESPFLVDEKGNKKKVKESKAMFPMTAMTKEFIPGTSLYAVEQTKDGYNLIPYNAISSLNSFIDNTAITFDPLYNAAEDIKAKETQTGNFVSVTGAKYSSTKVTPTQPAQFTKVKNKLVLSKKGIAFWGKPYDIKVKVNNNQAIQELRQQQDELYKQIDDIRSAEGAAQAEETGRAYKAKLNVMAKEIENNLTNIFDQMGVKRPETLTPKCP